jgi:hypothetical protein
MQFSAVWAFEQAEPAGSNHPTDPHAVSQRDEAPSVAAGDVAKLVQPLGLGDDAGVDKLTLEPIA